MKPLLITVMGLGLLAAACENDTPREEAAADEMKSSMQEAGEKLGDAAAAAAVWTEENTREASANLKAGLAKIDEDLARLKERAANATAESKAAIEEEWRELADERAALGEKFDEFAKNTKQATGEMAAGLKQAADKLGDATKRAADKYDGETPVLEMATPVPPPTTAVVEP